MYRALEAGAYDRREPGTTAAAATAAGVGRPISVLGMHPSTGRLAAAPDKFRGTASASQVAASAASAARGAGWQATEVPMADGGDGLLDAVGGEERTTVVTGPLGAPVAAQWRLLPAASGDGSPTAVIEMARASGIALVGGAAGNDPVAATTRGTGELVMAAVRAGARRVVVGAGGSATTDGGLGALEAIGGRAALRGAELLVACDVTTPFLDAATVFGPQKGADPAAVELLSRRLASLAARYRDELSTDVTGIAGAGAAGGLAGGLAALGAHVVSGFDLVAELVGLDAKLASADLVVTGEGRLDPPSFAGKVVGGVIGRVGGRVPVLCVVGDVDAGVDLDACRERGIEVVSLVGRFGRERALAEAAALVGDVVAAHLAGLASR
ncbi:MAG TPA: glycerate kinase [Acidimicrobiales bacterium]|nr:glycerate kinase [Acidimicrobiales bacterium]